MKIWNQTIPLLRNDKQKVVANGYPDLRVNCVRGGSVESLDVKVLFDPLEEKFNLPPFAVQFGDGERVFNREVVGQEAIGLPGLKVLIHTKSQRVRILPGRVIACEPDGLIRKNARTFVDWSGLSHFVGHIVLGSHDKVCSLLLEVLVAPLKSHISFVHQIEVKRKMRREDPVIEAGSFYSLFVIIDRADGMAIITRSNRHI